MEIWQYITGLTIILILAYLVYLLISLPLFQPKNGLKQLKRNGAQKTQIIFLGDSLTHALISFDYVNALKQEFQATERNMQFINLGHNFLHVYHLLERSKLLSSLSPKVLFILIGTNDCNFSSNPESQAYSFKHDKIPTPPSFEEFEKNFQKLLKSLKLMPSLQKNETKICLITIPPIGEDPTSSIFQYSKHFAQRIRDFATEYHVDVIDFFSEIETHLHSKPSTIQYPFEEWKKHSLKMYLKHCLCGTSLYKLGNAAGFQYHADYFHLNAKGGRLLTKALQEYLNTTLNLSQK